MDIDTDKLEDRAVMILGQIQASVAEYVRTMNEAGALRRREIDEAQRQQDEAIRIMRGLQLQASVATQEHSRLAAKLGEDWIGLVERGLREVAVEQARIAANASVTQIDFRLNELDSTIREALVKVGQLARSNERISRSLAWKTIGLTAVWLIATSIAAKILLG